MGRHDGVKYIRFFGAVGIGLLLAGMLTIYLRLFVNNQPARTSDVSSTAGNAAPSQDGPVPSLPADGAPTPDEEQTDSQRTIDENDVAPAGRPKRPADLMDMTWDSWPSDVDFSNRERLAESIARIPIKGEITMTPEQRTQLHNLLCELLFDFGNDRFDAYYDYLRNSKEVVPRDMVQAFRRDLINEIGLAEDKIATDPWELLSQSSRAYQEKSLWQGLVSHKSHIDLFEARTQELPVPGEDLNKIRRAIRTFRHVTVPPLTFGYVIESQGHAIVADARIFITHSDEVGAKVRPYVIRLWYDSANGTWRPLRMAFFPNAYERLKPAITF